MYPAAQLSYSYDTDSTAGPEYIYNMLVTVYFDVTENPPEADPNISILEPVPGSTVEGIETISTYIVTGDSDIDIESVAFYADSILLGSDSEAPFLWHWDADSAADGEHVLTAAAVFSNGESVESEGVTVVVGEASDTVAAPIFNPAPGEVFAGTEVTITCSNDGAAIYYTIDESDPNKTVGTLYTAPIVIDAETTLSAIAVKEGLIDSTVTTGIYELNGPKIVFISSESGTSEIYTMNIDGTDVTKLTSDGETKYEPSFSPDGTKITYIRGSDADDTSEVYVMDADGSKQTRLTFNTCRDSRPVFSPDGNTIAFSTMRDATSDHAWNSEVYVMNSDGSFPTRLTYSNYADYNPSFAPDGESIVFNSRRDNTCEWAGNAEIYVMNANGSAQTRLTYTDGLTYNPVYSPDGTSILYQASAATGRQIFEMAADGSNPTQLTFGTIQCSSPMYSPDGRKIVFWEFLMTEPPQVKIYIMNRDGTSILEIADGMYPSF